MKRAQVAVIGGGLAGLAAARALAGQGVQVTLFEREPVVGGGVFGVDVPTHSGGTLRIDGGASDFNVATSHEFKALVSEFTQEFMPISQDASYLRADGSAVLSVLSGAPVFSSASAARVHQAQFDEWLRFRREGAEVLADARFEKVTAGQYLVLRGYSEAFIRELFAARARAVSSMPAVKAVHYPMRSLVRQWVAQGAVGPHASNRVTLRQGLHSLVPLLQQKLIALGVEVRTQSQVRVVRQVTERQLEVHAREQGEREVSVTVDQVVLAVNPESALAMLDDVAPDIREALLAVPMQRHELVVHHDASVMPGERKLWGAFVYQAADEARAAQVSSTRWVNRQARLDAQVNDVFVTVNPGAGLDERKVVQRRYFMHPVAAKTSAEAQRAIERMQGKQRLWFSGSWVIEPWGAESAVVSALRVSERILEGVSRRNRSESMKTRETSKATERLTAGEARYVASSAGELSYQSVVTVAGVTRSAVDWHWPSGLALPVEGAMVFFGSPLIDSFGFSVQAAQVMGLPGPGEVRTTVPVAHSIETRRTDVRAPIRWPAVIRVRGREIRCRTENVSTTGALLQFETPVTPGQVRGWATQSLTLELQFPSRMTPLVLSAHPVRLPDARGPQVRVAVAFKPDYELDRLELELAVLRATSRREPRVNVSVPCGLAMPGAAFDVASVMNLSASGARVQMAPELAKSLSDTMKQTGQQFLKLRLRLPGTALLQFDVSVVRRTAGPRRHVWALQFESPDQLTRTAIAAYVLQVLRAD